MILPEFNFQIKRDSEAIIKRLLQECDIHNFWIAPMGEDRLTVTIEASYEQIERFNKKRKAQR